MSAECRWGGRKKDSYLVWLSVMLNNWKCDPILLKNSYAYVYGSRQCCGLVSFWIWIWIYVFDAALGPDTNHTPNLHMLKYIDLFIFDFNSQQCRSTLLCLSRQRQRYKQFVFWTVYRHFLEQWIFKLYLWLKWMDPDRQALNADSDPDPARWCQSDPTTTLDPDPELSTVFCWIRIEVFWWIRIRIQPVAE